METGAKPQQGPRPFFLPVQFVDVAFRNEHELERFPEKWIPVFRRKRDQTRL